MTRRSRNCRSNPFTARDALPTGVAFLDHLAQAIAVGGRFKTLSLVKRLEVQCGAPHGVSPEGVPCPVRSMPTAPCPRTWTLRTSQQVHPTDRGVRRGRAVCSRGTKKATAHDRCVACGPAGQGRKRGRNGQSAAEFTPASRLDFLCPNFSRCFNGLLARLDGNRLPVPNH